LPLDVASDSARQVSIHARTRLLDPPSRARVVVSINGRQIGTFAPDTQQPSGTAFTVPPEAMTRGFNRVVFEKETGAPPVAIYRVVITR
jgi:hypothetical protein